MKLRKVIVPVIMISLGVVLFITGAILFAFGIGTKNIKTESFTESITSSEEIVEVKVKNSVGDITVKNGSEFSIECKDIIRDNLDYSFENGVFELEYDMDKLADFISLGNIKKASSDGKIVVTIPQKVIKNVDISDGVGKFELNGFEIGSGKIDAGVGNFNVKNCTFGDGFSFKTGVGELEVSYCSLGNISIKNGVGHTAFKYCKANGNIDIKNGVGQVEMTLEEHKDKFDIDIDNGIGKADVTNNSKGTYSGTEKYEIDIENGIGNVDIKFVG